MDLFHFLLRRWFSSPGGALPLLRQLSGAGAAIFWTPLMYPPVFFGVFASPL
jgi:hypothetical protein